MRPIPVLVSLMLAGTVASAADDASFKLPRSAPEVQGVSSSALLQFVEEAEQKIDSLHSLMIVRHGQVIAEGWWAPYAAEEPHQMFSLSKSFTSTAVGLAIADGKFSGEDPVLSFFPDEAPAQPSANLRAMRVRDLLTMSTGHHQEDIAGFNNKDDTSDVRKFLALPVAHKPGTFFVYNGPATFMLSAIVQKTTGQTVLDYLRPRLFEPLGIENPAWVANKQGISMGGTGLSIRTEDIAKFGQLYLQKGKWNGKQLLPAAWVESATLRWMSNGSNPASDWEQGYGFQFWRCRHGVVRGDGAHGQFCLVFPEQDAVVAITAGTRDLQGVLNVVWAQLLPALQVRGRQAKILATDPAAHAKLKGKLAGLSLRQPVGVATPPLAKSLAGKRYVFPANPQMIDAITVDGLPERDGIAAITVKVAGAEQRLTAATGAWRKGLFRDEPVAASGAWTAADTYTMEVVRYRTPFVTTHRMRFAGDELFLETKGNLGPTASAPAPLVGKRE